MQSRDSRDDDASIDDKSEVLLSACCCVIFRSDSTQFFLLPPHLLFAVLCTVLVRTRDRNYCRSTVPLYDTPVREILLLEEYWVQELLYYWYDCIVLLVRGNKLVLLMILYCTVPYE